jgi:hypothetical protein
MGKMIHPTGMWQILISQQSSGQHPTLPYQRHRTPIIQTNRGTNDQSTQQSQGTFF